VLHRRLLERQADVAVGAAADEGALRFDVDLLRLALRVAELKA
jgi:hypothetical protein